MEFLDLERTRFCRALAVPVPRARRHICNGHSGATAVVKAERTVTPLDRELMERDALRLLCSAMVQPGTRLEICRLLRPRNFLDDLRSATFEEIQAAGLIESRQLRASLSVRMRSRGFPDFNLAELLAPRLASEAEIEQLFESTLCLLKIGGADEPTLFASEADDQD